MSTFKQYELFPFIKISFGYFESKQSNNQMENPHAQGLLHKQKQSSRMALEQYSTSLKKIFFVQVRITSIYFERKSMHAANIIHLPAME